MHADRIRPLFDLPDEVAYMACASQSPLPRVTHAAGIAGLERKRRPWTARDLPPLATAGDDCRRLFAGLIGASGDDIAIVPASSYGTAVAAANLPLARGQSILLLERQYPSNYYVWADKAAAAGAQLATVPRPADGDWTAAVLERLAPGVAIAALPPCHWTDGASLDLVAIGAACRRVGAALVIDATQLVGAAPFDVAAVQPDFLVASAYKWLFCPYTLAFLYVAPHRQSGRPLEMNEAGRASWDDQRYCDDFAAGARRFDMGEPLNHVNIPMAAASLELISGWGPVAVAEGMRPLTDQVAALAADRGWRVPPRRHRVAHYIGFRRAEAFTPTIEAALAAQNVHVSLRAGGLRVAPYLFTRPGEIDRLFAVLDRLLQA